MIQTKSWLFGLCLFLTSPVFALKSDQNLPYQVTSDQAIYHREQHISIFIGHVVATQGSSKTTGQIMKLYLDRTNKQIQKITCYGHPATYSTELDKEKERLYTEADTIHYDPKRAKARLITRAKVVQGQNSMTGSYIVYNMNTDTVESNPKQSDNQTKIMIQPHDIH